MSNKEPRRIGKGMSALLGGAKVNNPIMSNIDSNELESNSVLNNQTGFILLPIEKIYANLEQPRKIFKDKEIEELSNSIKENGIIQPIIVTESEKGFMIISGERRFRAAKLANLKNIPVVIKRATKKDQMAMAIIENVQRENLNCVEEALAYFKLMTEFNLTQEEVAKKIGKERSTIANFLRVLKLPKDVVKYVQKDLLSFGHAKILVSLKDDEKIRRFATIAIDESLSVRELEKLIKIKKKANLNQADASNKFFEDQMNILKGKLESKTGYHFDLKSKNNGSGAISIKFNNEAEFNDIFDYLMNN